MVLLGDAVYIAGMSLAVLFLAAMFLFRRTDGD